MELPKKSIPDICKWVSIKNNCFKTKKGYRNEYEWGWYCCTEQKVLSTIFTDGLLDLRVVKEVCSCLKNPNRNMNLTKRIVRSRMITLSSITLGIERGIEFGKIFLECYKNKELTDYKIRVQDKVFHVHKIFLISVSPLFKNLFRSDFKKAKEEYVLTDEDPDRVELFLDALYSESDLAEFDLELQLGLMEIAIRFEIDMRKVQLWVYDWPLETCFKNGFNKELYFKYREIILSLEGDIPARVLAEKIKILNKDFDWSEGLDERYADFKHWIQSYLDSLY